jgi:hypothetical protein
MLLETPPTCRQVTDWVRQRLRSLVPCQRSIAHELTMPACRRHRAPGEATRRTTSQVLREVRTMVDRYLPVAARVRLLLALRFQSSASPLSPAMILLVGVRRASNAPCPTNPQLASAAQSRPAQGPGRSGAWGWRGSRPSPSHPAMRWASWIECVDLDPRRRRGQRAEELLSLVGGGTFTGGTRQSARDPPADVRVDAGSQQCRARPPSVAHGLSGDRSPRNRFSPSRRRSTM